MIKSILVLWFVVWAIFWVRLVFAMWASVSFQNSVCKRCVQDPLSTAPIFTPFLLYKRDYFGSVVSLPHQKNKYINEKVILFKIFLSSLNCVTMYILLTFVIVSNLDTICIVNYYNYEINDVRKIEATSL